MEELLGIYFVRLFKEGKRFAKIKSLSFLLQVIQATKRVRFLAGLFLVSYLFSSSGFIILTIQGIHQLQSQNSLSFDSIMLVGLFFLLIGSVLLYYSLQEKRWDEVFRLTESIKTILSEDQHTPSQPKPFAINQSDLSEVIDQLIEKRLKTILDQQQEMPYQDIKRKA